MPEWEPAPFREQSVAAQCAATYTRRHGTVLSPHTGDPLPERPAPERSCNLTPQTTRWLGRSPHVPFALVDREGLRAAETDCCAAWARPGSCWRAVDAWGQVVGTAAVSGGSGYDATSCYELCLSSVEGREGIGVYVSTEGSWAQPASARWRPSAEERAAFVRFYEHFDTLFERYAVASSPPAPPLAERTFFFQLPESAMSAGGPTRFAAVGGDTMTVLTRRPSGQWMVAYFEGHLEDAPARRFEVLGVFDMDGDGAPEVLLHRDDGDGWHDEALRTEDGGRSWYTAATSVGGGTA